MKYSVIIALGMAIALSACSRKELPPASSALSSSSSEQGSTQIKEVCYDGVVYLVFNGSMTAKFSDRDSRYGSEVEYCN